MRRRRSIPRRTALAAGLERVGRATEAESKAVVAEAETADKIQPLREQEAAKGAVLHRFKVEQDNLEREAQRAAARQRELEGRIAQLGRDLAREESLIAEAKETLARLDAETAIACQHHPPRRRLRAEGAGRLRRGRHRPQGSPRCASPSSPPVPPRRARAGRASRRSAASATARWPSSSGRWWRSTRRRARSSAARRMPPS